MAISDKKMIVDNITEFIGHTPLIRLRKISREIPRVELLGKCEFLNPGGSIKDRPCLAMIEDAERKGILKEGSVVIEPTTGNTGIGLAMICAVKGYRCILALPEDLSLERIYLLKSFGAEVILTKAKDGVEGSINVAKELKEKTKNSFMPLQFQSSANPLSHRDKTAPEIWKACDGKIDAFVAGVGTGGTITGVGEFLKEKNSDVKIIAVEPANSAVLSGKKKGAHHIQGIGAGFVPEILNLDIVDQILSVDDRDAYEMAKRLAQEEGLCVGISSGANVAASLEIAKTLGSNKRVVTILCDTGERYFSTEQYFEA